jgi:hypothetical protein
MGMESNHNKQNYTRCFMGMQVFVVNNAVCEPQPRNIPVTLVATLERDALN